MRLYDGVVAVALLLMVTALSWTTRILYWLFDDAFHLLFLLEHGPTGYLFAPSVWKQLPFQMFTPLQMISYEIDLRLFGINAQGFYAHQLAGIALSTLCLYVTIRLFLTTWTAAFGVVAFFTGAVTIEWVHLLMLRHYVEGFICACLAFVTFVLAIRKNQNWRSWLSGFLYLFSGLFKEVFVPLPFLLLVSPVGPITDRLRYLRPHLLFLMIYLVWRYTMLGTLLGGYGWSVRGDDWAELIVGLPAKFWNVMFGAAPVAGGIILLTFLGSVITLTIRSRAALGRVAWAAVLAIAPIVPVSTVLERRYAVLLWLLIVVVIACACEHYLSGKKISLDGVRAQASGPPSYRNALVVALVLVVVTGASIRLHAAERARTIPLLERMSVEGRSLMRMEEGDILRHPAIPPAALNGLRMLGEKFLGARAGVRWFYDDIQLCEPSGIGEGVPYQASEISSQHSFWQYSETTGVVEIVTAIMPAIASSHCGSIRWDVPLEGEFRMEGGALQWTLGPYQRGTYSFILDNGTQKYEMPREGGFRLGPVETLPMRLRYDSPEGWTTYSPELVLDFRTDGRDEWRRR